MTFEIGALITLVCAIITGAMGYGKLQRQVDEQKEENSKLWAEIGKLRTYKEQHDEDVAEKRVEYEREMSRMRESITNKDGKLDSLMEMMRGMDKKIDRLEERNERRDTER